MLTPAAGRDCIGKIVHLLLASSQSEAGTPKPVERQQHKKKGNERLLLSIKSARRYEDFIYEAAIHTRHKHQPASPQD